MEVFEVISPIKDIEIIAVGSGIRDVERLRKTYGSGRWRKLKGFATVRLEDGFECLTELHWYEKENRAIPSVKPYLEILITKLGFRLSPKAREAILKLADEI